MNFDKRKTATLILANGEVFEGYSFGKEGEVIGEIVFTTSMTGYQETLTDPSYCGQIVVQTFPLIGNYGTNSFDYESGGSVVHGYIVREHCEEPSNFRCESTIDDFLKQYNIIGLYGIDTRRLTKIIREAGVMNGMITSMPYDKNEVLKQLQAYRVTNPVPFVSTKERKFYKSDESRFHVVLMDYGYKHNIRRSLLRRGCDITLMPWNSTAEEIKAINPDGIMLSNGPGDPADCEIPIKTLKELLPAKIPTFGICLGHQLLALANGGKTMKLKYGHRGGNQPVTDLYHKRTFITSQNHGYAVVNDSISEDIGEVSHINANDGTNEGIRYKNAPAFTVQFHPEAFGGPRDTSYLFDAFLKMMEEK
jgi:carbamoyl-phosphate synthase small subunit